MPGQSHSGGPTRDQSAITNEGCGKMALTFGIIRKQQIGEVRRQAERSGEPQSM